MRGNLATPILLLGESSTTEQVMWFGKDEDLDLPPLHTSPSTVRLKLYTVLVRLLKKGKDLATPLLLLDVNSNSDQAENLKKGENLDTPPLHISSGVVRLKAHTNLVGLLRKGGDNTTPTFPHWLCRFAQAQVRWLSKGRGLGTPSLHNLLGA